jgi:di/tricarboxylate transporter
MTGETVFVFGLLLVTILLFASDRVRLDVVSLLVILALMLSGSLSVQEAVAGFSDPVVLMIAGLFVVGEGLVRTGVAYAIGDWLMRVAGTSEIRMIVFLMLAVAGLGAFISSTGVVAIFIPVVLSVAAKTGASPGRLMMPLAFAALISGMLTLIATPPNLIVNADLRQAGLAPLGFFSFTPVGLVVLAVGIGYLLLVGRRLLPGGRLERALPQNRHTLVEFADAYGLAGRGYRLRLKAGSPLVGQTVAKTQLRTRHGVTVVGIRRQERFAASLLPALADTELRPGDELFVLSSETEIVAFVKAAGVERLEFAATHRQIARQELGLAEVMLPPQSDLIGRNLAGAAFRSRHGLIVLGIKRKGKPLQDDLSRETLAFGDCLLVAGGWKQIGLLQTDPRDFLVLSLPVELDEVAPARRQAPLALLSLLVMIVLMTFNLVPNVAAVLLAALAMGLFRCVDGESAYRAINWQSLVLIAGMLPFALALQKSGGVALIVDGLIAGLGQAGPLAMLASIFALTAIIGLFVSNTATAVLMAPIAIATAQALGLSPHPFAVTVAIAASAAFVTPVSSPVNTLVLVPGNYRFNDFVKVGLPMLLLVMLVTLVFVPLLFPLGLTPSN